jgi:hypothetical protein
VIHGIDVSSIQPATPDLTGKDFIFVKATEGRSYVNPKQEEQAAAGRAAGAVVGFYHFLWPGNITEQAAYFVEQCASVPGDVLAVDWESTSAGTHATCAEKDAFIKEVLRLRGASHRVILYCNRDFWLNRDDTSYAGDGLWIADYVTAGRPRIQAKWLFHQYTDSPLDQSVADFASRADLKAWATRSTDTGDAPAKTTPTVSLSKLIKAAKTDPKAKQGHQTYAAGVKVVEAALVAAGYLDKKYAHDGSFGSLTVEAYAKWQRHLGYTGKAADGIPGKASLTALGKKHGFKVGA